MKRKSDRGDRLERLQRNRDSKIRGGQDVTESGGEEQCGRVHVTKRDQRDRDRKQNSDIAESARDFPANAWRDCLCVFGATRLHTKLFYQVGVEPSSIFCPEN